MSDVETAVKSNKSIVPSKYGSKYKGGGSDELANFINEQAKGKEGFDYELFFKLCSDNGVPQEKVDHYRGLIAEGVHGAQGRARMTLRNLLATIGRKEGKLLNLQGDEVAIDIPKPAVSGAAKARQEAA